MLFEVYSDGSGTTGDQPGGYGYVICLDGKKILEGSGRISKATNNVAEVTAAIRGLSALLSSDEYGSGLAKDLQRDSSHDRQVNVVLISDSQLVLGYANGSYQCRKPHLLPLYLELRKLYKQANATTRWVRGHSGDTWNEKCDQLAKAARQGK